MTVLQSIHFKPRLLLSLVLAGVLGASAAGQAPALALPDAPQPAVTTSKVKSATDLPCMVKNVAATMAATAAVQATAASSTGEPLANESFWQNPRIVGIVLCVPHMPAINWYARFLNGPQIKALTPLQKAHLAARNLLDPFNLLTIAGEAAIAVAANSHSPYGPGMPGYGRYVGVSFTQNLTGEFLGTFLIPSIVHQDPHYHRMPEASIARRARHTLDQVLWTRSDNNKGMPNYANVVSFAAEQEIGDLYVPGQQTNLRASAERYGLALATAPIDNVITEFLPDVARHIHVQVVIIQRIINQVAKTSSSP